MCLLCWRCGCSRDPVDILFEENFFFFVIFMIRWYSLPLKHPYDWNFVQVQSLAKDWRLLIVLKAWKMRQSLACQFWTAFSRNFFPIIDNFEFQGDFKKDVLWNNVMKPYFSVKIKTIRYQKSIRVTPKMILTKKWGFWPSSSKIF